MTAYSRRGLLALLAAAVGAGCSSLTSEPDGGGSSPDDGDSDPSDGSSEENGTTATMTPAENQHDETDDQSTTPTDRADGGTPDDGSEDSGSDDDGNCENGAEDEQADRKRDLERLPEPSPLSLPLRNLYVTADREALAEDRELIVYRDGRVRVSISLEPEGRPPEQYLPDEYTRQGGTVVAVVAVDDLVDLALDENVRLVRLPPQPEPHE